MTQLAHPVHRRQIKMVMIDCGPGRAFFRFAGVAALAAAALAAAALAPVSLGAQTSSSQAAEAGSDSTALREPSAAELRLAEIVTARRAADVAALQAFRPAYPFWQHIYSIPDGSVAFGSAANGRLIAVFPAAGDWRRAGKWEDPSLAGSLQHASLPRDLERRRDRVAEILADAASGPVVHNPTRGRFLLPNAARFGTFLDQ